MSNNQIALDKAIRYHQSGKFLKAEAIYKKILKNDKSNADAWHLLGVLFYQLNQFDLCISNIQKAIKINPNIASFYSNIGLAYHKKTLYEKAIACYKEAIKINPDYPEALNNLANSLREIAKKDSDEQKEAINCYKKALKLKPQYQDALNNFGNLLMENESYDEALKCYEMAVKYNPKYADAFYNIGFLYKKTDRLDIAIEYFQKALSLTNLTNEYALNSLFEAKREICDWSEIDKLESELINKTLDKSDSTLMDPFTVVSKATDYSQMTQYRLIKKYSDKVVSKNGQKEFMHKLRMNKKIRLGYVCANLFNHPTMQNTGGLLSKHDRDKFDVYLFGLRYDEKSKYFIKALNDVDKFIDLSDISNLEAAQKIYDNEIDILIDMQGYIAGARTEIFSYRPAPIQLQYHAYPGTMACDFIDYIITDEIITPIEEEKSFGEKFIYMPDCYFITDDKQQISEHIPSRVECGLPNESFVFCSFNNAYKIEPKIFAVWMDILKETDKSVLWIYSNNKFATYNLEKEAIKAGLDSKRLIFAKKLPKEDHLARIKNADIFLDTYFCNAHTTAIDALHADLPIITCKGKRFASRVASSILAALGMDELITNDLDSYKELAVKLAKDKNDLNRIRAKLIKNKKTYPLFDTKLFVRNMERGFMMIWSKYLNGQKCSSVKIESEEVLLKV